MSEDTKTRKLTGLLAARIIELLNLAGSAVQPDHPGMSNARPPIAHAHTLDQINNASEDGRELMAATRAQQKAALGIVGEHLLHGAAHAAGGADPVTPQSIGAATAAQGAKADTAIQPGNAALTDARPPTAHKASHAIGGSDALTPAAIGAAPADHTHSDIVKSLDFTELGAMRYGGDAGVAVEGNIIEGLMRLTAVQAANVLHTLKERNRYV